MFNKKFFEEILSFTNSVQGSNWDLRKLNGKLVFFYLTSYYVQ